MSRKFLNRLRKNKKIFLAIQICSIILIAGSFGGLVFYTDIYDDVQGGIVEVLCLSCIKLEPVTSKEFTFDTANGEPHADFVEDTLKNKGIILIQYGEKACFACDEMIQNLIEPYFNISFFEQKTNSQEFEITLDNLTFQYIYIYIDEQGISEELEESWQIYDKDHIEGFPMFVFITIEYEHSGDIKPYYTTLYGKLQMNDDYQGMYEVFYELLEQSAEKYDRNIAGYK